MTNLDTGKPEPGPDAGVDDIRADIEATRKDLGQTVEALSAKLDVKQQAKQKVNHTKELIADKAQTVRAKGEGVGSHVADVATDDEGSVRPAVPVAALALLAAVVGVVIWKRRRR
jgi:Protein of unknown function (DUF3618)